MASTDTTAHIQTGREALQQWIDRRQVNQREAARIIGVDHTYLNQILSGRRTPGLDNAIQIERATGIAVEVWLPTSEGGTATEPRRQPRKH